METVFLIGRVLFGGYFLMSGINHVTSFDTMACYAASKGVPHTNVAVVSTVLLLILGGAGVILGLFVNASLLALALFLVGVTPVMHKFWTITDPMQKMGERIIFMKNSALLGALLMLYMIALPWPMSV